MTGSGQPSKLLKLIHNLSVNNTCMQTRTKSLLKVKQYCYHITHILVALQKAVNPECTLHIAMIHNLGMFLQTVLLLVW